MNETVLPRVIALAQVAMSEDYATAVQARCDLADLLYVIGHDPERVTVTVDGLVEDIEDGRAEWVQRYRDDAARIRKEFS